MYLKAAGALFLLMAGVAHAQIGLNVDVETRVAEYFADSPVMVDIARCESKFRQYTDTGNPLHGGLGGAMVGVYQVHSDVHAEYAKGLGMDIYTLEGNLAYAKRLYEREGTRPWISSFPCWGKELNEDIQNASADALTLNLSLGMEHPQILLLQKMLNAKGYTVATEGPGSAGEETQKFGAFTRAAVKKFQCATIAVCDGDEHSTGYGFVGSRTRVALAGANAAPLASEPAPTTATTPAEPSEYTPEQHAEIERLQAQIVELTKTLAELLAKSS